jgi:hypothetical protein
VPAAGAPGVAESHTATPVVPAQPGVQEYRNGGTGSPLYNEQYQPRTNPAVPAPGSGSSLQRTAPAQAQPARPPVPPKLDRVAVQDGNWKPVQTASR